jgi:cytochrome o ubiquinol oxidase subunit 2
VNVIYRGVGSRPVRAKHIGLYLCICAPALVALLGCHFDVLDPRGPISQAEKTILIDSLAIMLAIVVPTILATVGIVCWYRASNTRARYLPEWAFSGRIELVVWSIPVMVIILLGGVTWIGAHQLDPARPLASRTAPIDIQVVSLDWKWLFIYPKEGIASVNQIVAPADVPLHFSLTSASVMNAFFVPQLGSMIYTMNGMATQLYLRADAPGTFRGLSAQYSGEGFSDMHFDVRVVPEDQFVAWIDATREKGGVLNANSYATFAKQSINAPASTFSSVEPGLFKAIVAQDIAPSGGPQIEHAGARPVPTEGR